MTFLHCLSTTLELAGSVCELEDSVCASDWHFCEKMLCFNNDTWPDMSHIFGEHTDFRVKCRHPTWQIWEPHSKFKHISKTPISSDGRAAVHKCSPEQGHLVEVIASSLTFCEFFKTTSYLRGILGWRCLELIIFSPFYYRGNISEVCNPKTNTNIIKAYV